MSTQPGSRFVYVTYIRTTVERLWEALTDPTFQKQYWFGVSFETDWRPGAPFRMVYPDGRVTDAGRIAEAEPPTRLVLEWRHELRPELKAEGYSRCVWALEPTGQAVKLTITHSIEREASKLIDAVSGGWPQILSNLKSLLETGATATERVEAAACR